jgi:hypothetical protein
LNSLLLLAGAVAVWTWAVAVEAAASSQEALLLKQVHTL